MDRESNAITLLGCYFMFMCLPERHRDTKSLRHPLYFPFARLRLHLRCSPRSFLLFLFLFPSLFPLFPLPFPLHLSLLHRTFHQTTTITASKITAPSIIHTNHFNSFTFDSLSTQLTSFLHLLRSHLPQDGRAIPCPQGHRTHPKSI